MEKSFFEVYSAMTGYKTRMEALKGEPNKSLIYEMLSQNVKKKIDEESAEYMKQNPNEVIAYKSVMTGHKYVLSKIKDELKKVNINAELRSNVSINPNDFRKFYEAVCARLSGEDKDYEKITLIFLKKYFNGVAGKNYIYVAKAINDAFRDELNYVQIDYISNDNSKANVQVESADGSDRVETNSIPAGV